MYGKIKEYLQHELAEIEAAGLYKRERIIASPQRAEIEVAGRKVPVSYTHLTLPTIRLV